MHNLKSIRENPDIFRKKISSRNVDINFDELLNLDKKNREIIQKKIDPILNFIPNIALDDVPSGKDEKSNKELKKVGEIPKFNFKILSHYEIGKN